MSQGVWSLEVVRGKSPGRVYPLSGTRWVLGNDLNGSTGVNLAAEEGEGPRRMAAQQAQIEITGTTLSIRDLDSPGGTFVNRQRILPGQSRPLQPDDVVQLGGVQLKVRGVTPSSRPVGSAVYSIPGGPTSRTWDDVLVASAQRWAVLRDELQSGRLERSLRDIGRADLIPPGSGTPDERLDAWLGALPTTRPKAPSLDVHPETLVVSVNPGGGTTRRKLTVSNVGLRLLKVKARVEAGAEWLTPVGEIGKGGISVVESAEVAVEIAIPDALPAALTGILHFESNGGDRKVAVRIEPAKAGDSVKPTAVPAMPSVFSPLARFSAVQRSVGLAALFLTIRGLTGVLNRGLTSAGYGLASQEVPGLLGPILLLAAAGSVIGGWLAHRRGGWVEVPTGAFASALAGVFGASIFVATWRAVEPLFGALGKSSLGQILIWGALGAAVGWLSKGGGLPTRSRPA